LALTAIRVPELIVAVSIRADLHLAKLALAAIMIPFVTRVALAAQPFVVCISTYVLVVTDASAVLWERVASIPSIRELASLIKAVAKVI